MKGQINLNDEAGSHIFNICQREDVKIIVEIGAWNGQGSTFCVYSAIKDTAKKLISLEVDRQMFNLASEFYSGKGEVAIMNGHISDELISIDSLDDSFFTDYSKELKSMWHQNDSINIRKTPNILDKIPKAIDFLILDGGEYSSWHEYLLLKDRSRIIFLDDTRPPTIKNYMARADLLSSQDYRPIVDKLVSRNGFCIFEK